MRILKLIKYVNNTLHDRTDPTVCVEGLCLHCVMLMQLPFIVVFDSPLCFTAQLAKAKQHNNEFISVTHTFTRIDNISTPP